MKPPFRVQLFFDNLINDKLALLLKAEYFFDPLIIIEEKWRIENA